MAQAPDPPHFWQILSSRYPSFSIDQWIYISVEEQRLWFGQKEQLLATYPVSTATNGPGNHSGSNCTPLGLHHIREKHGAKVPFAGVMKSREFTGEIAVLDPALHQGEDLITSRILWLGGLEPGLNQGPGIDSYQRYIYLHGTQAEHLIGQAASHGCVRLRNQDIIDLFDQVAVGTLVYIGEQ
ncbi:MAG: L,D-transpeptidase [Bacteroidota bacterium]